MKILLYSYAFYPSTGGVETVSLTIADNLIHLGHQCTVVTETSSASKDMFNFPVVRKPSVMQRMKLVKDHDVIHSNGASLALFFYAMILRKPFIWTHVGYQVSCVDGLGWSYDRPSPVSPLASILFHIRYKGYFFGLKSGIKLFIRRVASKLVSRNIAITKWMAERQPLKNQKVIYNPFPLSLFKTVKPSPAREFDFVYVGRLVSEKGADILLKSFSKIMINHPEVKLLIIGDGQKRKEYEKLAVELEVNKNTTFAGKKTHLELIEILGKCSIGIIPSRWEEPMGGVAIELLAAGLPVIVSKNGGLAECVGNAGLVFENSNVPELSEKMLSLYNDKDLQMNLRKNATQIITKFDEEKLTKEYLSVYEELVRKS